MTESKTTLSPDCGHHCGTAPMGHGTRTAHCACKDCHKRKKDTPKPVYNAPGK